jgi:cation transporter-like permease
MVGAKLSSMAHGGHILTDIVCDQLLKVCCKLLMKHLKILI